MHCKTHLKPKRHVGFFEFGWRETMSIMNGTEEDDVLNALGYDVTVHGGAGNDTISGDLGSSKFYGDEGNDILIGGAASNGKMWGGEGSDTFVFEHQTYHGANNHFKHTDVKDYEVGDKVVFTNWNRVEFKGVSFDQDDGLLDLSVSYGGKDDRHTVDFLDLDPLSYALLMNNLIVGMSQASDMYNDY